MRNFIRNLILKWLLRDYEIKERQMSERQNNEALIDFAENEGLQKLINIIVASLIRRHLYVKTMDDKYWYSGQVTSLLNLQKSGKRALDKYNERKEKAEKNKPEEKDDDDLTDEED